MRQLFNSFILVSAFLFFGCAGKHLHTTEGTVVSQKYNTASDSLYYLAKGDVAHHYPKSGFYPLEHNFDAFSARLALIDSAKVSLDLQYFIFAQDETSNMVVQHLLRAAQRGVRVRLLVDDLLTGDRDMIFASLAQHPNIEIKLFNPTHFRKFLRWVQLAFNVDTLGRRMHNKLLIADNSAVILGGRNIENIYFAADNERIFLDNDVLAIGPLAAEASNSFETYWDSPISLYIADVIEDEPLYDFVLLEKELKKITLSYSDGEFMQDVLSRDFAKQISQGELPLIYANADLYYDIPTKITTSEEQTDTHLSEHLDPIIRATQKSLIIVNPYFIPNDVMMAEIRVLRQRGVKISVLTNSLATNDAIAVYAAYSKYQKELIALGVELYELNPKAYKKVYESQGYRHNKIPRSSLHAKSMIVDDNIFIIGSVNLDPRSIKLNTEVAAVIYSKEMARFQKDLFHEMIRGENVFHIGVEEIPDLATPPTLDYVPYESTRVVWKLHHNTGVKKLYNEGDAGFFRRLMSNLSKLIPLEKYL